MNSNEPDESNPRKESSKQELISQAAEVADSCNECGEQLVVGVNWISNSQKQGRKLHRSIQHNVRTGKNMVEINLAAIKWHINNVASPACELRGALN